MEPKRTEGPPGSRRRPSSPPPARGGQRPARKPQPAPPTAPRGTERPVLMAIDPETREALRLGDTPQEHGPAFFTSLQALEAYCEAHDLVHLEPYEVPAMALARMKGKPHWVDGRRG